MRTPWPLIAATLAIACSTKENIAPDAAATIAPDATAIPTSTIAKPRPRPKREAPPLHEATRAEAEKALKELEADVKEGATDPRNAWALAHGVTAFGKDLKASNGRLAIDVMVEDYVQKGADGWSFPANSENGGPVAPHKDLLLKTIVEAGVPLNHVFKTKAGKVTLQELLDDAEKRFVIPQDDAGWRDYAWSEYAMLLANKSTKTVDTARGKIGFAELAWKTEDRLELEQKFLEPLLGRPEDLEKRRQGIYAHHCGGLHFVQSAVLGATIVKDPVLIERVKKQLDLVLFRWDGERRIYEETILTDPKYRWLILVQELKFYGHILETFALAKEYGLFEPDAEMSRKMRQIAGDLANTTTALAEAYRKDAMSRMPPQTQLDLIGDGCHAIRGLRKSLVAFFAS